MNKYRLHNSKFYQLYNYTKYKIVHSKQKRLPKNQ